MGLGWLVSMTGSLHVCFKKDSKASIHPMMMCWSDVCLIISSSAVHENLMKESIHGHFLSWEWCNTTIARHGRWLTQCNPFNLKAIVKNNCKRSLETVQLD